MVAATLINEYPKQPVGLPPDDLITGRVNRYLAHRVRWYSLKSWAVAALLVALWAMPALAQPVDPDETIVEKLEAAPQELRAGETVTVTGGGCSPGNQVRFELYNPDLDASAEGFARADGTFVQSINLATTTTLGRSWLRATCLGPDSEQKVMEAVLLVHRAAFVVTWTNVFLGAGAALITAGIGLAVLRQPAKRHHSGIKRSKRGSGKRHRRKRRKSSGPSSNHSKGVRQSTGRFAEDGSESDVSVQTAEPTLDG